MRALFLCALLALPALADPPADAPIIFTANPDGSRTVPAESWVRLAQSKAACTAERDELRKSSHIPLWVPIAVGALAFGAGAGLVYFSKK